MDNTVSSFHGLMIFCLDSVGTLAHQIGFSVESARGIRESVATGRDNMLQTFLARAEALTTLGLPARGAHSDVLGDLANLMPKLMKDSVDKITLEHAKDTLFTIGELAEQVKKSLLAYNFYETSYHIAVILDQPALGIGESTSPVCGRGRPSARSWRSSSVPGLPRSTTRCGHRRASGIPASGTRRRNAGPGCETAFLRSLIRFPLSFPTAKPLAKSTNIHCHPALLQRTMSASPDAWRSTVRHGSR